MVAALWYKRKTFCHTGSEPHTEPNQINQQIKSWLVRCCVQLSQSTHSFLVHTAHTPYAVHINANIFRLFALNRLAASAFMLLSVAIKHTACRFFYRFIRFIFCRLSSMFVCVWGCLPLEHNIHSLGRYTNFKCANKPLMEKSLWQKIIGRHRAKRWCEKNERIYSKKTRNYDQNRIGMCLFQFEMVCVSHLLWWQCLRIYDGW